MKRGRPITRPSVCCERCGSQFRSRQSNANKFCSLACSTASRTDLRSPEFITLARAHWNAGHSVSETGARLGVSKGVIAGIMNRNDGFLSSAQRARRQLEARAAVRA